MKGVMILEIKNLHTHVDIVTRSRGGKWTQKNKSHFPSSETTLIFRANCT